MSYLNVAEIETVCNQLAADHGANPELARLIVLPELTHEGRTSRALHIGNASQPGTKPVFMIVGGLHGDEWGSSDIILNLAADLLEGRTTGLDYGPVQYSAQQIDALLQSIDLVLLPCANPDGRFHTKVSGSPWRKNRNQLDAQDGKPDTVGVDLNRNFDFVFDMIGAHPAGATVSSSNQAWNSMYQGRSAASEPETKNVQWLAGQFPTLRWFVDLHSGAREVVHPWADDESQPDDGTMAFHNAAHNGLRGGIGDVVYREYMDADDITAHVGLAQAYVVCVQKFDATSCPIKPGCDTAVSGGMSHDWAYSRHLVPGAQAPKTLALLIEWYRGYVVPWRVMPPLIREVSAGLIEIGLQAQSGLAPKR